MTKELAEVLAKDIYVWGWPIVNSFHRREGFAQVPEPGLMNGTVPIAPTGYVAMLTDYIAPEQRWVAHPNQDVIYGFGYAAVDDDPVVLQVPDFGDRFWVYALYDARTEEFSNIGKQYGTKPGNYLVVGPNWKGDVPDGIAGVIYAPTELVAMGPRLFMDDSEEDRKAIQKVLNQVVIYPLSEYTGKSVTKNWKNIPDFKNEAAASTSSETQYVDPDTFFDELPGILAKVPPLPGEESRYAMIAGLLDAAKNDPEIAETIKQAANEAETDIIAKFQNFRTNGVKLEGGWNSPPNVADWGYDYVTRTATAKSNMYTNQPTETRYFFLEVDSNGDRLNGDNAYTVTFPKGKEPPVNGFWSLTMYDPEHFFESNEITRYSVGTKNAKAMTRSADGSLTIYIQHDSPGRDKEANWLPAPDSEFELTLRTYWPKEAVNTGDWMPPAAVKAD
ncbi:DUF1254 domain-containing protein [Thalassospira lucentensis]|uniref:DUF1254 domain-containing protein n=1 Tax=Thalassospira lucentensis TaxID=168935 RepID=UPI003D2CF591